MIGALEVTIVLTFIFGMSDETHLRCLYLSQIVRNQL